VFTFYPNSEHSFGDHHEWFENLWISSFQHNFLWVQSCPTDPILHPNEDKESDFRPLTPCPSSQSHP
jgi:hypothetical protein